MKLTSDEIKEGGSLIAAFMGGTFHTDLPFTYIKEGWYNTPANDIMQVAQWHNFKYHDSWDWTMPVVEKINGMGKAFSLAVFKNYVSLTVEKGGKFYKDFSYSHAEYITAEQTGKVAMFKLLVSFIKWQNEQLKNEITE